MYLGVRVMVTPGIMSDLGPLATAEPTTPQPQIISYPNQSEINYPGENC